MQPHHFRLKFPDGINPNTTAKTRLNPLNPMPAPRVEKFQELIRTAQDAKQAVK
jgi:hypothetical protein